MPLVLAMMTRPPKHGQISYQKSILLCRCITDDPDTYLCLVSSDSFILVIFQGEVTCNTFCISRASHYSKSTPSQPYHTLETQKEGSTVDSTSVQWLYLRVSPEHACWEGFQMCLVSVHPEGHTYSGSVPRQLLADIPDQTL